MSGLWEHVSIIVVCSRTISDTYYAGPTSSSLALVANETTTPTVETSASSWCLADEDKKSCFVRFAKDLLGVAVVFAKQR